MILKLAGKYFTDCTSSDIGLNKEYNIPSDEIFFDEVVEGQRHVVVNDITKDRNLQKELQKYFKMKVVNLMYLPIILRK